MVAVQEKVLDIKFDSIEDILADFKQGKMVVMLDDEDRENEGDLIIAAEKVKAADINFMVTHGRGLVCLVLSEAQCAKLNLPLMQRYEQSNNITSLNYKYNTVPFGTKFTLSVEAARGVTTGISAQDRATTIHACINQEAKPTDIVCPGHIFPIMAQEGGVLARAGHTEATIDLARLSGLNHSGVLVEILNEDGTMARRDDLIKFANKHNLKIGTVADLINYRLNNEKTVNLIEKQLEWPTRFGEFSLYCYQDKITKLKHYALTKGVMDNSEDLPYIRVHVENKSKDLLQYKTENWPLDKAIEYIANKDNGVVVILSEQADHNKDYSKDYYKDKIIRDTGIGCQILNDLGVSKMKLLTNHLKYSGLAGFNLEVVEYISYE